VINDMI